MQRVRVIPVLTVVENRLVKTVRFRNPHYIGDPINAIKIFNDKEVDEVVLLDIGCAKNGSRPNYRLIEEMAGECFMPLAYGGGIRSFQEAERILGLGAEKVVLNTALRENRALIGEIAAHYGEQAVIASVDYSHSIFGKAKLAFASNSASAKQTLQDWIARLQREGAGEILLHAVDRDGTFKGYDLKIISEVAGRTQVPVIACGGGASMEDMKQAIASGASAVAASSLFVYRNNNRGSIMINYPTQKTLETHLY